MAQYTVELQSAIGFVYVAEASSEEDAIKMAKSILEQESEDETQVSSGSNQSSKMPKWYPLP